MTERGAGGSRLRALGGVAALVFLAGVTAAWWALALWPTPDEPPAWLARTRWVCFNAAPGGLPDASGWLLLVGQPLGMLAFLMVGWGPAVRSGLALLRAGRVGRALLVAGVGVLALGLGAAGARIAVLAGGAGAGARAAAPAADAVPRLDQEAPPLGLADQHGQPLDLERLRGRPALVTFAFGQCESVCPLSVREVLAAQEHLRREAAEGRVEASRVPRVVVVTLDPWRDTPSRLPHLARHWKLERDAFVLSGSEASVNRVLDAWKVARRRDASTGDVSHPPLVYVLDASGRIAYAASGGVETLAELIVRS